MNTTSTIETERRSAFLSGDWFASVLRVLTTPACWLQNQDFCPEWDKELNRLMQTERFTEVNRYTAKIGGHLVWVANHPYASFTMREHDVRPSRATILRAKRKLMSDVTSANTSAPVTER